MVVKKHHFHEASWVHDDGTSTPLARCESALGLGACAVPPVPCDVSDRGQVSWRKDWFRSFAVPTILMEGIAANVTVFLNRFVLSETEVHMIQDKQ